ncbi:YicC family protein [bacterium (candidate division B38) B3_B38]|nr:MAG: YicC family protein [bacterium (candidate division B38) B3_B38]
MIMSMTGYGHGEAEGDDLKVKVEIRSLNHRFFEVNVRMPEGFMPMEDKLRKEVRQKFHRGKFDVLVHMEQEGEREYELQANLPLIANYLRELKKIKEEFNLGGDINIETIWTLPHLIRLKPLPQKLESELESLIMEALGKAISSLEMARMQEGEALAKELQNRLLLIKRLLQPMEREAPRVQKYHYNRLKERVKEFNSQLKLDEDRLLQEVLYYAEKEDITEELVRIKSHLKQCEHLLSGNEPCGKKLDFISQELFREVNAIASKLRASGLMPGVLTIKSEVEKLREQAQNIE